MRLVWFRRDLRVEDNPALFEACASKKGVIGLYIATKATWARHHMGENQQKWLFQNLDYLEKDLNDLGIPFVGITANYFSECADLILDLMKQHGIQSIYFNDEYEWDESRRDLRVIKRLRAAGIAVHVFHDQCLIAPDKLFNQQGRAYTRFTSYKKAHLTQLMQMPELLIPSRNPQPQGKKFSNNACIDNMHFMVQPGSAAAKACLDDFIINRIEDYHMHRDFPSIDGTSQLSPYFALGVISVRTCIQAVLNAYKTDGLDMLLERPGVSTWISELIWRDFYKMICYQYPQVSRDQPFQANTATLSWHKNNGMAERANRCSYCRCSNAAVKFNRMDT